MRLGTPSQLNSFLFIFCVLLVSSNTNLIINKRQVASRRQRDGGDGSDEIPKVHPSLQFAVSSKRPQDWVDQSLLRIFLNPVPSHWEILMRAVVVQNVSLKTSKLISRTVWWVCVYLSVLTSQTGWSLRKVTQEHAASWNPLCGPNPSNNPMTAKPSRQLRRN